MGKSEGNCPSEEFLNTRPIESYDELKIHIESLFNIEIKSDFFMSAEKIVTDEDTIKRLKNLYKIKVNIPSYNPKLELIIIPPSFYNERVFVHEVLHSFSNLTLENLVLLPDYSKNINFLIREGLTEFLTGCILFRFYPNCYKYFREPSYYGNLYLGYKDHYGTKFWYVFVRDFGIDTIVKLYFDKSLKFKTHAEIHNLIIRVIKDKYPTFDLINPFNFKEWQFKLGEVSEQFIDSSSKVDRILDFQILNFL